MLLNYAGEDQRSGLIDSTPIRLTTSKQRFDSGRALGRAMSKKRRRGHLQAGQYSALPASLWLPCTFVIGGTAVTGRQKTGAHLPRAASISGQPVEIW
jgi:hypothetical protein